jgi:exonuclease SbcD
VLKRVALKHCKQACRLRRILTIFKFIHAADIHLDSSLRGLQQYEGAPVEEIRRAPRDGLVNLVNLAIEQSVEFVLIAGDLYDGNWKNFQTGMFFVKQAARLREAGIKLFLIAGNHDAANKMTRSLPLPENVKFFSADGPETVLLDELDVAIHGQSFAKPEVLNDLSLAYPAAVQGCFNIGLLHTSADGREEHDPYAPCSIEGLKLKGYDYWALGHIHKREVLCREPWVAFCGNIQGRHIRETGAKGCMLVTVDEDRRLEVAFEPLDVMRWELATLDLSTETDIVEVPQRAGQLLQQLVAQAAGRPLAVRIELHGATALHRELQAELDYWVQQMRGIAVDASQGKVWIEKVKLRTRERSTARSHRPADDAAIGELTELFAELRVGPNSLSQLGCDLEGVLKKLPPELKARCGLETDATPWLTEVLDQAESLLMQRLQGNTVENSAR